jgi:photosystem II stability/assembly factor-like uncharacterized protein
MSVRSAVDFRDVPTGNETLAQVLTNGNDAEGKSIIGVSNLVADTINGSIIDLNSVLIQGTDGGGQSISNINNLEVQSINGFSTNRNSFGEFIAQQTIPATANTDFTIDLTTPITLTAGGYLANIKINLTATTTSGYYIYLYLDGDLLTSSYISSASNVNGTSLVIPSFPVGVPAGGGSLIVKGRVNATGSVVVAGFGDSYIFCGEIFKGVSPPPNPPPITTELVWTAQTSTGNLNWTSFGSSTDGVKLVAGIGNTIYTSVDAGVNWTFRFQTLVSGGVFVGVASSADGVKLVACGSQNNDYIYTSIDSGITWVARQQSPAQNNNWNCCASSADGVKLVVGGYQKIWTSADSGATWLSAQITSQQSITAVGITPNGNTFVCSTGTQIHTGNFSNSSINTFLKYTDTTPTFRGACISSDGLIIYASGSKGVIRSIDGGANWTTIITPVSSTQQFYTVYCSSDGTKVILYDQTLTGTQYTLYILVSNNTGATFTQQTSLGNKQWVSAIISPDGNRTIAGGYKTLSYTGVYV